MTSFMDSFETIDVKPQWDFLLGLLEGFPVGFLQGFL